MSSLASWLQTTRRRVAACAAKRQWQLRRRANAKSQERDVHYYDALYRTSVEYAKHYTDSRYYFLWTVVVDRLRRSGLNAVLEIGCGSGQLACLLRDQQIGSYCGVDLSEEAITRARSHCPEYTFITANIFESGLIEEAEYEVVILLEFLEHVWEDLAVLARIRPGTRVLGSVPNFPYESHVRHFEAAEQVRQRYESLLCPLRVDAFAGSNTGITYYLLDGIRRDQ